ncbi:MAG: Asp-tRNAAsn/Glu-tRNAGln amidotransferase subunit and related amidase [Caulobacter sp.]|nr:Asp-tRNAAsn/Glu-tRNAGln amidotransferase subunit and related amidase [Caulobacter sp.]
MTPQTPWLTPDPNGESASSQDCLAACLAQARDPDGEGARVFTVLYDAAQAAAASDARRAGGAALSPLDGAVISIKDLFDVAGEVTLAGSTAMAGEPAATADAEVVGRLRAAGAVIVGKTNMTEFALSGLGLNPHFGTPLNPWRRDQARIPGGSSSGAAVSVSDGMAAGAIGTDTGGSVRIPAAFCGLTGFKPTAARVGRRGVFALAASLDSVGPIARDVTGCQALDAVLSGQAATPAAPDFPRLAVPRDYVLDSLEPAVAAAFDAALHRLEAAGAVIEDIAFPELARLPQLNAAGGFSPIEGFAAHATLFERIAADCDPRVMNRFLKAGEASARDYFEMLRLRAALIDLARARTRDFDALVMPTVAVVAPRIADLADDAAYYAVNGLVIRNAATANLLDRCAISIPCQDQGEAPVGLMLVGAAGADRALLSLAAALESAVRGG